MKKLSLKKQKITSLSSKEMNQVVGGGQARSNRLDGGCSYSRNHPKDSVDCDGNVHTTGCTTY